MIGIIHKFDEFRTFPNLPAHHYVPKDDAVEVFGHPEVVDIHIFFQDNFGKTPFKETFVKMVLNLASLDVGIFYFKVLKIQILPEGDWKYMLSNHLPGQKGRKLVGDHGAVRAHEHEFDFFLVEVAEFLDSLFPAFESELHQEDVFSPFRCMQLDIFLKDTVEQSDAFVFERLVKVKVEDIFRLHPLFRSDSLSPGTSQSTSCTF